MTNQRVLLCMLAHPDDCEILCAGTVLRLAREHEYTVHLATCTAGDCGSEQLPPDEISRIRRAEARRAATLVDGTYHCLELRDLKVAFCPETVHKALELFRQVNPSLVITHPRHDYMLDHEQCHLIARAACFGFAMPNASPAPAPVGAGVPYLYYCDPLEGRDPYTGQPVRPTTVIDITQVIDDKARMLACHDSQRRWLRAYHGMDEYLDAMKRHGAARARPHSGCFAEAFVQHRGHAFPTDDLLWKLLSPPGAE
jgi:LmbE family N-acetylglucosaminyl deacetylase